MAIPPKPSTDKSPAKPNRPVPSGVRVERQPSGHINSKNEAGGEVPPDAYRQ